MEEIFRDKRKKINVAAMSLVFVFLLFIVLLTYTVLKTFIKNITYSDISPDYHSFYNAYVVDQYGKGIDSVAVFLKDNSNFNLIYRTFTDSEGKFELFNDFHSFALLNTPTSFELHTYFKGVGDTTIYKFKKYRVAHFKKVSGPDTIVLDGSKISE